MNNEPSSPFAVASRTPEKETLQSLLKRDAYRNRFEQVMGPRAPQFISSILSLGSTMHDVEPKSVLAACAVAASLNLPIDKNLGYAWIVPYKKNGVKYGSFQLGYHGLINLAQRTAAYERLNAEAINAEAYKGRDAVGEPIIDWGAIDESKPVAGYAFAFKLTNGFIKTAYWTKEKVIQHAQRYSQSYRAGGDTPWTSHFDSMALKVVIANTLRKWGMLSVEMQGAFAEDHAIHRDIDAPAEFPDAMDEITRPKFDGDVAPRESEGRGLKPKIESDSKDEKAESAAGLAPAEPAKAEQPKRGRPKKEAAAPATQPAAKESPTAPQQPAETPPAQPQPTPSAGGELLSSPAYGTLRDLMSHSQVTEAELFAVCKQRGLMEPGQEELRDLSDHKLAGIAEMWPAVAGQIRINRTSRGK